MTNENYPKSSNNDPKSSKNDEKSINSLTILKAQSLVSDFKKAIDDSGWLSLAEESWRRFKQHDPDGRRRTNQKRFPLWYSTGKIRQPLVFSKVPEVVVQPIVPDKTGFVTEVASIAEKLSRVLVEQFPFFSVARSASDDNLLTSMGVARIMVDAEFVTEPQKEMLQVQVIPVPGPVGPQGQPGPPVPQEQLVNSAGEPVDPASVLYTFDGEPYLESEEVVERVEKETAFLKSVCYKEFIWDWEARDFAEWDYCGFKSRLTKAQVVKRFGQEALEKLPKENDKNRETGKGRRKYDVIELWWKPNQTRYIFALGADEFLKEAKDPLKLDGFFPIAYPLFSNLTSEDSIPFTEYGAVKGILDHIDDIYDRKAQALRISRSRGLYDSSIPELKVLISNTKTSAKDWIGVPNLATKAQQGSTFTQYLDTNPVINALNTYRTEFAEQLQAYDQITRLSDSVRGVTNPYESATATERKAQSVNHGIVDQQQDMQRWCRDSLKLLLDAALAHFSDDRIFEMVEPTLSDKQRENFEQYLSKLKSDSWRIIALDIETDSTILIDEDVDKQQAGELAGAIGGLLDRIGQMVDQAPEGVPLAAELMHFVISKYRGGKEFQDKIEKQIEAMVAAAQQRQAQAGQPPPPTPLEQAQINAMQGDQQIRSMEQQVASQKLQAEFQLKNRELDRKDFEVQIEAQEAAQKAMLEQQKFQFEQILARFEMQLENAGLQIEDFKARAQASESMAEEIRLAKDTEIAGIRTMIEAQRVQPSQDAQTPMIINMPEIPVNLQVQSPRQGKRVMRTTYDELGNATHELEESEEI